MYLHVSTIPFSAGPHVVPACSTFTAVARHLCQSWQEYNLPRKYNRKVHCLPVSKSKRGMSGQSIYACLVGNVRPSQLDLTSLHFTKKGCSDLSSDHRTACLSWDDDAQLPLPRRQTNKCSTRKA